jgi:Tfp pilus assembly protein PilO
MNMTARDRKILIMLAPVLAIGAFWFLVLAPKRQEATAVSDQLAQVEAARDTAKAQAAQVAGSKEAFSRDYATVIRLGKSVPAKVDMPSLLVQLDAAAKGTGIDFISIQTGDRTTAATTAPAASGTGPNAPGAPPAQSGAGKAAQAAGNATAASAPAGTTGAPGATTAGTPEGLESVPLDFEFTGSFFDLAAFFHDMKRFVRVANDKVVVNGRLITIDSFSFDAGQTFPSLKAAVHATVYLAPKSEGATAGASPNGPAPAAPGAQSQTASASTPPAATVTR